MTERPPTVLAVDIGSSSVRVALRGVDGEPVGRSEARVRYAMTVDDRGGVSIEPGRLIDLVGGALDRFVERVPERAVRSVRAVGISCFLHSVAGLDGDGRTVTPLLTWADTTSAPQARELRRRLDEPALWQATGCPLHASYWPAKILRLREVGDGPVRGFAGAPSLVYEALTGVSAIDLSHASGTGLLDRATGGWHGGLLEALELQPADLPPIAGRPRGRPLRGSAAARWPALAAASWFVPWSDAWCGNLGLGRTAGRGAALQVGTSGAMRVIVDPPDPPVPGGLFAHRLPGGRALVGGQLSEGGGAIAGMARLLGSRPDRLEAAAAGLPPAGHGLTVLPYLAGERGPGYHAEARGTITGLTLGTSPEEVHLAMLEAVAFRIATIDRRLQEVTGGPADIVAGGGALSKSSLFPAIVAAALDRPIRLSSEDEASTRGAALLALAASGLIDDPSAVPPPPTVPVEPDPGRVAAYGLAMARQQALYERLLGEAP